MHLSTTESTNRSEESNNDLEPLAGRNLPWKYGFRADLNRRTIFYIKDNPTKRESATG